MMIFVRALHKIELDVVDQCRKIRNVLPGEPIVVVADCMRHPLSGRIEELTSLGVAVMPLELGLLYEMKLSYVGVKTGWLCGDYVFYAALRYDWDYCWVIEPDVQFVNGGEVNFSRIHDRGSWDLLASRIRIAEPQWSWQDRLRAVTAFPSFYAMQFPLVRMSRGLVEDCLLLRRRLYERACFRDTTIPNDESLVATVAGNGYHSTRSINEEYPALFRHFHTIPRYLRGDIERVDEGPGFVHSVVDEKKYWEYVDRCLASACRGEQVGMQRFDFLTREASGISKPLLLSRAKAKNLVL